jgi:hypothetical protein
VELSLTMYQNTTALISDAQPLLEAQVLQLQLITGYVLLLTKSLTDCWLLTVLNETLTLTL